MAGPTMSGMLQIRKTFVILVSVLLLSYGFAQTAEDRVGPIASALQNKEFEQALALLRRALQASPGNAQLWAMQGVGYAGEGKNQEALASFHNALKLSPDYLAALPGAIQIEYESGSPAAIPLLQHMLRLRPRDSISHAMLAVLPSPPRASPPPPGLFLKT